MRRLLLVLAACGHAAPSPPGGSGTGTGTGTGSSASVAVDAAVSDDEKLAAIQLAMNQLDEAAQQCWAAAAVDRFDVAGEVTAQIDIGPPSHATIVHDTTSAPVLTKCLVALLEGWQFAPPLRGQSVQLPFQFKAPAGQSVIDRQLARWKGQGKVSVAVLLDQANSGNAAASMLEVALSAGGSTGQRTADRAELWYFLGPATVAGERVVDGDMVYVPAGGTREIAALDREVHAVLVLVPGGKEGVARAGALPTREASASTAGPTPVILRASKATTAGPATIYLEAASVKGTPLAASILQLPGDGKVPEHVHAQETEMLYVLTGAGTMTVAGTDLAVTQTSVIQIPPNTTHAFAASAPVRALQIYTPAGPEQRFKKKP